MSNQNKEYKFHQDNPGTEEIKANRQLPQKSILQILWNGRFVMILAIILSGVAGIAFIRELTPMYSSTSRIYVGQSGPKIITEDEGVMTRSNNYLYTQAELLKSTPILIEVLNDPNVKQMKTLVEVESPVQYLKDNIETNVGASDDLINLSFNSPYPEEAAQITNIIVEYYIAYHDATKKNTSAEVLEILRNQKEIQSQELVNKLRAMMNFKRENAELALEGSSGNIVIERLQKLSLVLTEAQIATVESMSIYESLKEIANDPVGVRQFVEAQQDMDIPTNTERELLSAQLNELELRLIDRLKQVNNNHPAVTTIESKIKQLQSQIEALDKEFAQTQLAVAEKKYIAAQKREAEIRQYYQQQRQEALELNEQLAQYTILESEWEQTKNLCETLDNRIKELDVTEDVGVLNISVFEQATPAANPFKPEKARIMAIALVCGLIMGGALSILRELLDQRLRTAEEITAIFGAPILGIVPTMSGRNNLTKRGQKIYKETDSYVAEAYRSIRTGVLFGTPNGSARTILITSPTELEGKTILASNLAIAMAQAGQKTLLLDANFRNPRQYKVFEIKGNEGLISLLSGTSTLEKSIHSTEIHGLDILPSMVQLVNPSEILNSESFRKLLMILSEKYDRIIIDSPPVVPVTDARILAAICDSTIMVLRAKQSKIQTAIRAREGLASIGIEPLGVVVNDVPKKKYSQYYGYYKVRYSTNIITGPKTTAIKVKEPANVSENKKPD